MHKSHKKEAKANNKHLIQISIQDNRILSSIKRVNHQSFMESWVNIINSWIGRIWCIGKIRSGIWGWGRSRSNVNHNRGWCCMGRLWCGNHNRVWCGYRNSVWCGYHSKVSCKVCNRWWRLNGCGSHNKVWCGCRWCGSHNKVWCGYPSRGWCLNGCTLWYLVRNLYDIVWLPFWFSYLLPFIETRWTFRWHCNYQTICNQKIQHQVWNK